MLVNLLVMDVMKNGKVKFADINAKKSAATNSAFIHDMIDGDEMKKTVMMDDTTIVAMAEDDKADWNAMMDSERTNGGESDMINVADIKNHDEIRPAETEQDNEVDIVVEDDGESEVIKLELPGYDKMNFNWKKAKTFYQGQSEGYKNN